MKERSTRQVSMNKNLSFVCIVVVGCHLIHLYSFTFDTSGKFGLKCFNSRRFLMNFSYVCCFFYVTPQMCRHEVVCAFLPHLHTVSFFGPALRAVCELLELTLARWFRLGLFCPGVQLASCAHGVRDGGSLWQW